MAADAGDDEAFIIGGAELYRAALPLADRLYLTRVHAEVAGDTHFPLTELRGWRRIESEHHKADDANDFPFTFEVYKRL
jgi:dihydrofolate reductase